LARRSDVQIVFPVHPNPQIRYVADAMLRGQPNIALIDPLPYISFIDVMRRAHLIVTDSGGIQEEAPCLGKPVLLLREKTERMEGVLAGTVKLVGTSEPEIVARASELLDDNRAYQAMAKVHSPYGDGNASARISQGIWSYFDRECGELATGALYNLSRAVGSLTDRRLAAVSAS
jgi:UDP-N-acetylglucosamine 2-epimerase